MDWEGKGCLGDTGGLGSGGLFGRNLWTGKWRTV